MYLNIPFCWNQKFRKYLDNLFIFWYIYPEVIFYYIGILIEISKFD